jgi:alpha-galactosidase
MRAAAGQSYLIGCNTIGHLGAGLFELQRTGDDTSGREWERTRKMGINTLAFRSPQHDTFFAADADCVGLTRDVPWELNSQWLALLARSGTPLFVSADPAVLGPQQKRALSESFALAAQPRPTAEPLDWLDSTCPAQWLLDGEQVAFDWYPV